MNIAEILKYCPKGTKLYSTIFGIVEFEKIVNPNIIKVILPCTFETKKENFFEDGHYSRYGECVLFPSKDQRDWSKFRLPVKRGDIMMEIDGNNSFIASDIYTEDDFPRPKAIYGMNIVGDIITKNDNQLTSDFYIPLGTG